MEGLAGLLGGKLGSLLMPYLAFLFIYLLFISKIIYSKEEIIQLNNICFELLLRNYNTKLSKS